MNYGLCCLNGVFSTDEFAETFFSDFSFSHVLLLVLCVCVKERKNKRACARALMRFESLSIKYEL